MSEVALSAPQQMVKLLVGFIPARAIYAAARLGLADHMGSGGSTAQELAQRLGADASALERLMRTLTGIGVLRHHVGGRFSLTEIGETLRVDSPGSIRDYALFVHEFLYDLFGGLAGSVRSGKPAVETVFGSPLYVFLQANPEKAALFHSGLSNRGRIEARAILDAYDFSGCRLVVDVGGGNGGFLSAVLKAHSGVSAALVERPSAIEAARAGRGGPLPRCEMVEGDFFQSVPRGGDLYVLKRVLVDHTDEKALQILRNCLSAMKNDARLLIIEPLSGALNEPSLARLMDLTYLLAGTGRTRSEDEHYALLERAGLRLLRCLPTQSDVSVLEAMPG
ncbi:MAG TPA: methyltransferase [Pseudolabrys sp.]|nr:methyltransferase [Pseudolabrys sp.]